MTAMPDPPAVIDHPAVLGRAPVGPAPLSRALIASFVACVVIPSLCGAAYLWEMAADRYASNAAFSIRSNEAAAPVEIFGAVTQLGNSSAKMDGEILYDFIQSQQMLDAVRVGLDLEAMYQKAPEDPLYVFEPGQPVEDLLDHWERMLDVSIDPANGILTIESRAYTPDDARAVAEAVLAASAELVNTLSESARSDAVRYSAMELAEAEERLREIRLRLRAFRDFEQEVDPTRNAAAALDLVATLEQDRARTQVRLEQIASVLDQDAPRVVALKRRLATLDARINEERTRLGTGDATATGDARPLAAVVGDYEELLVDREFAEQAYTLALTTYEQAQAEARRQNRYLAVHIRPTLPETAAYPDRPVWLLSLIAGTIAIWAIGALVIGNIRERR
ncbi:MAG: capsule biosynthesis protein [Pseudomonadota bacterium]